MILSIALFILIISKSAQQFTLNCTYRFIIYDLYTFYSCNGVNVLTLYDDRIVTEIIGKHTSKNTNNDVKSFHAQFQNCHYVPLALGKFFPNLEYLSIQKSNLQFLLPGDLDELNKLKFIDFSYNPIEVINANYFSGHDEIETLKFYHCHLKKIEKGALDMLKKLSFIDFQFNYCYSGNNDFFELEDILRDLYDKCNGDGVTIKLHEPEICENFDIEAILSNWIKLGFIFIIFLLIVCTILGIILLRIYTRNAQKNWHEMSVPMVNDDTERNCE